MKALEEMNIFDLAYELAKGNEKVKNFIVDCLMQKKAFHEFLYLYEQEIGGDEILQIIEEVQEDKDDFAKFVRMAMKEKEGLKSFLYGKKFAFPLLMFGQRKALIMVRETQIKSLLKSINKGEITRQELIDHTEGISFQEDISTHMKDVAYERGRKKVIAKEVALLVTKPVEEVYKRRMLSYQ